MGIKIGRNLAVTGFNDLPFAARMEPPLTTVRTDCEQLGYQAAWLGGSIDPEAVQASATAADFCGNQRKFFLLNATNKSKRFFYFVRIWMEATETFTRNQITNPKEMV